MVTRASTGPGHDPSNVGGQDHPRDECGVFGIVFAARKHECCQPCRRNESTRPLYAVTHAYDPAGNATTLRNVTGIQFNDDNQRTGTGYWYDGNGHPTIWKGVSNNQYDAENRLTSYGSLLTAGYNGDGLRAWKQTANGRTYFLYDVQGPVCELDASGNVTSTITASPGGLISRRVGSTSTFYVFDPSGNVAQRLDASGNVLSSDLYDAYGNRMVGSSTDPYGYGGMWGYYTDVETGLILCTYRYYDPQNGRWLTRDPLGYLGGVNLYAYVNNNPENRADPEGLRYDVHPKSGTPMGVLLMA